MQPTRSYLICSVQRSGSWLLSHALQDTGALGSPAEYFHRGDEPFWRGRWGASTEDEFLDAVQTVPVIPNGVWGAKMMWNYFDDATSRLRAWPALRMPPDAPGHQVLAAAFPGLRYIWLRRADKLRQAISWWRADLTGQYALTAADPPVQPPPFDRQAINALLRYAQDCEDGWRGWFGAGSIEPFEIRYEDLPGRLTDIVRDIARFLDVAMPDGGQIRPRLLRQADHHTERLVRLFNHPGESAGLEG